MDENNLKTEYLSPIEHRNRNMAFLSEAEDTYEGGVQRHCLNENPPPWDEAEVLASSAAPIGRGHFRQGLGLSADYSAPEIESLTVRIETVLPERYEEEEGFEAAAGKGWRRFCAH
jgi:hypothetical protein